MKNDDAILAAALREIFGLPCIADFNQIGSNDGFDPLFAEMSPRVNRNRFRPHSKFNDGLRPCETPKSPAGVQSNQEMANKINELYNELNQKDRDLKEARESVKRLQDSVRDFRKRAETAEMNAARTLAAHNELSANFNDLVEKYNTLKVQHQVVNAKVDYLLNRIRKEQADTPAPTPHNYKKFSINENGEIQGHSSNEVDAISIPLSEAEEIINRFRGV